MAIIRLNLMLTRNAADKKLQPDQTEIDIEINNKDPIINKDEKARKWTQVKHLKKYSWVNSSWLHCMKVMNVISTSYLRVHSYSKTGFIERVLFRILATRGPIS